MTMERITDLIQCSICLETFTDPRMLPCIHTFCLKCLQQTVLKMDEEQSTDKLRCPICRMEIDIPPQGVEGFQKNFFMHRLKEISTMTQPLEKSCDMCLESKERDDDEVLPADVYCIQCHKNICRRCSKIHKSIEDAKEHRLIPLGTEITKEVNETIPLQYCPQHKNEQLKMYCSDCKEVICVVCFAENHGSHKCSSLGKAGPIFRQELTELGSVIQTCLNEWLRKKQQRIDDKTNFQSNVENIERAIISRKSELIALVDKSANSLLDEVASLRQKQLKLIQTQMDENERQQVIIESFIDYCKQMEIKGTDIEVCQSASTLERRAEELQRTHRTLSKQSTEVIRLDFEQTNLEELFNSENAIGRIKVSKPEKAIRITKDSSRKLVIPSSSSVYGVTKLENRICVLCREPNVIRIFHDQDSFDLQMLVELKQIENPWNIASSEKSKCLYVIEKDSNCIWKISTEDLRVTEWLTGVSNGPGIFSMTKEGHFLVIAFDQKAQLKMYNSDSEIICKCPLLNSVYQPEHIIRNPYGEFIFCYHEQAEKVPWFIDRLTRDGQTVISRFKPTDKAKHSNKPLHMAVDFDNNLLFVADCENDRVILLDSDSLNLIKILLTKEEHGIIQPWKLFYDGNKKQLIVGQWPNKVDAYKVSSEVHYVLMK